MKKIVVKIGADAEEDMEKLCDPKNVDAAPDHTIYFKDLKQFSAILSEKKLGLLKYLSEVTGQTVTSVSIELHRKKEAVSRDLHELEALGLVEMHKRGNKVYPKVGYGAIQINLKATDSKKIISTA
ncbi:Uncharacterised protein [uncultured archaeon]|nr:Uncharacterised protein [uncultured archaeon]